MSDDESSATPKASSAASKVTGGAAILAGAGTAAGIFEGREWADVAARAGVPFLVLLLCVYLGLKVGSFLAPYLRDAFKLHRDFVVSVKDVTVQQAAAIQRLADGHEQLSGRLDAVCTEQRETNRLLRAAANTPAPRDKQA